MCVRCFLHGRTLTLGKAPYLCRSWIVAWVVVYTQNGEVIQGLSHNDDSYIEYISYPVLFFFQMLGKTKNKSVNTRLPVSIPLSMTGVFIRLGRPLAKTCQPAQLKSAIQYLICDIMIFDGEKYTDVDISKTEARINKQTEKSMPRSAPHNITPLSVS